MIMALPYLPQSGGIRGLRGKPQRQPPIIRRNRGELARHSAMRQGERSRQFFKASEAHAVDLSLWQVLQAFGTFRVSVLAGVMKRKVCARTFTSAMVCWICGMWQAMHSLPELPAL